MALKNAEIPQLGESKFNSDLAFLCDLTSHMIDLNTTLQGRTKVVTAMFDAIKSFKCKQVVVMGNPIRNWKFCPFSNSVISEKR